MMGFLVLDRDGLEGHHAGTELFSSGPGGCDSYPQCLLKQVNAKRHTTRTNIDFFFFFKKDVLYVYN